MSMIIFDEERPSDSPFVERIWRSHSERGGSFISIAESRKLRIAKAVSMLREGRT